ncbi:Threonine--tRNA ligase [Nymphaea thermarum]|nr:Threonine--tRNA ligase [Nymphaea thermarum]
MGYCKEVTARLKAQGIRAELCHGERLPKLIRNAEKQKVPVMAVVGPKEVQTQSVTVRSRSGGEHGTMSVDDFIEKIQLAVENRTPFL